MKKIPTKKKLIAKMLQKFQINYFLMKKIKLIKIQ